MDKLSTSIPKIAGSCPATIATKSWKNIIFQKQIVLNRKFQK